MGSDWKAYYNIYQRIDILKPEVYNYEKGFGIYTYVCKNILFNFWLYYIVTKILVAITFFKVIKYFLKKNNLFVIMLFYVQLGIYLFIDCPFRNLIAIGISNLALLKILEREKNRYFCLTIIGYLFHKTIFITAVNYFIIKFFNRISKKYLYSLLFILLIFFQYDFILGIILEIGNLIPIVKERLLGHYLGTIRFQEIKINIVYIEKLLLIVYAMKNKEKLEYHFKKKGLIILYLSIVYFCLYHISRKIPILFRFSLYYKIFPLILIGMLVKIVANKKAWIVKVCYILYSFFMLIMMLKNSFNFLLPYKFIINL